MKFTDLLKKLTIFRDLSRQLLASKKKCQQYICLSLDLSVLSSIQLDSWTEDRTDKSRGKKQQYDRPNLRDPKQKIQQRLFYIPLIHGKTGPKMGFTPVAKFCLQAKKKSRNNLCFLIFTGSPLNSQGKDPFSKVLYCSPFAQIILFQAKILCSNFPLFQEGLLIPGYNHSRLLFYCNSMDETKGKD